MKAAFLLATIIEIWKLFFWKHKKLDGPNSHHINIKTLTWFIIEELAPCTILWSIGMEMIHQKGSKKDKFQWTEHNIQLRTKFEYKDFNSENFHVSACSNYNITPLYLNFPCEFFKRWYRCFLPPILWLLAVSPHRSCGVVKCING